MSRVWFVLYIIDILIMLCVIISLLSNHHYAKISQYMLSFSLKSYNSYDQLDFCFPNDFCIGLNIGYIFTQTKDCLIKFSLRDTSLLFLIAQWYCKWVSAAVRCSYLTVLEPHRGTAALFLYFTHYRPFPLFLFMCLSLLTVLFLLLGVNTNYRGQQI